MKDYLKVRFDVGEELGRKADFNKVVFDMRNVRIAENIRLFLREEWLLRG